MKLSQSKRILHILQRLSKHEKVCTKALASEFEESDRNIQRDLKLLKEFLEDSLKPAGRGCYRLIDQTNFINLAKSSGGSKEFFNFLEFVTLFDARALKLLEHEEFTFLEQLKRESAETYTIFDNPIEELQKTLFLEDLKHAIKYRRYCDIVYNESQPRLLEDIQPQRILYAKNNWYLAAMTKNYKHNHGFKLFRINFIDSLTLKSKTFHRNLEAEAHIKSMQSLFQDYKQPNYSVTLEVSAEVSRYFRVKKYLASQKIIEEREDGSLLLSFEINNDMEIIPLVRTWLPHLRVITPGHLDQKIRAELAAYLL